MKCKYFFYFMVIGSFIYSASCAYAGHSQGSTEEENEQGVKCLTDGAIVKPSSTVYEANDAMAYSRIQEVKDLFSRRLTEYYVKRGKSTNEPIIISHMDKYNADLVIQIKMNESTMDNLLKFDSQVKGPPKFVADFLKIRPSQHRETLALRPDLIEWSKDKRYLIMPNPDQSDHKQLMDNPKLAKDNPEGFGLIAWYIHPTIYDQNPIKEYQSVLDDVKARSESLRYGTYQNRNSIKEVKHVNSFSELQKRDETELSVEEIVKESNESYLSGPFNYTPQHLASLYELRRTIYTHLKKNYDINPSKDIVNLYFHTHYNISTNTTHLHIRVNQLNHPLELDKSITLNDLIEQLEKGLSPKDEFLKREVFHKDLKSKSFLESLSYNLRVIANPYKLGQPFVGSTLKGTNI